MEDLTGYEQLAAFGTTMILVLVMIVLFRFWRRNLIERTQRHTHPFNGFEAWLAGRMHASKPNKLLTATFSDPENDARTLMESWRCLHLNGVGPNDAALGWVAAGSSFSRIFTGGHACVVFITFKQLDTEKYQVVIDRVKIVTDIFNGASRDHFYREREDLLQKALAA